MMLLMVKDVLPVLVSVAVRGELEVPTGTLENDRLVGASAALKPSPVPVRLTVCGLT
jgi:hypothetical protein